MFDLGTIGGIASVTGLVAAIIIATYQGRLALRAREEANAERKRAASLEEHLARQRWQQLRSLGEQIDTLEVEGRQKYHALEAALHARLKEQYGGLLGVIATSTRGFNASVVRHWVTTGRLVRPWQIAEAISHLEKPQPEQPQSEDERWLAALLQSREVVPAPAPVRQPREITEYVAAYVLVAHSVQHELRALLSKSGQNEFSAIVLLDHLAFDCLQIRSLDKLGSPSFRAWGWEAGKSFRERFEHYQGQDFWIISGASNDVQVRLAEFRDFFEEGQNIASPMVIPTANIVERVRAQFPQLVEAAAIVLQPRQSVSGRTRG